jgi:hypothetical protein
MTGEVAPHLQPVIECLGDDDRGVRQEAARLLIEWGRTSTAVVPTVERMQNDSRPRVRAAVHHILERIAAQKP